jgi:7,8-didemethyl-8-hydroxy-5-deazariboflavin synthase CofG subunit
MRSTTAPMSDEEALALAELPLGDVPALMEAACEVRDRAWGRTVTYSPKVFLPVTNLCRNRCDYCSFRRSPGDVGAWTMSPIEIGEWLSRGREQGCAEALLCLGDKPESAFGAYRRELAVWGHESTPSYLAWASHEALAKGLLPHTNAGVLEKSEMALLRETNVSLGLMLENVSMRLCEKGMPHHRAPDKRPARRIKMLEEAGELSIPFTTGILIGIHRVHGHIQEVIVQSFRAHQSTLMRGAGEVTDDEAAHAIAMARLILDCEVSLQAPPNLNAEGTEMLLKSGINDFGGISPVTPDYINPAHAWPHVERLGDACACAGFELRPRLAIYDSYVERADFLDDRLRGPVAAARARVMEARAA